MRFHATSMLAAPLATSGATGAAPTAGTAICTLTTPPAGLYKLAAFVRVLERNAELRAGATVISGSIDTRNGYTAERVKNTVALDGSTSLTLNVTSNASSGTVYNGAIFAVRIG
jgi:hypothetical protein